METSVGDGVQLGLINCSGEVVNWENATIRLQKGILEVRSSDSQLAVTLPLQRVWRASATLYYAANGSSAESAESVYALRSATAAAFTPLEAAMRSAAASLSGKNAFDAKTDEGSAALYFHYYGMLQHQQNMLQDYVRTGSYYAAITENRADFEGKTVMDVGAGSGILSLFAAQAGAKKVYAAEASDMADFARALADANPDLGRRVEVRKGKVEDMRLDERVDVLVSEPMGTLLVNERMLETYLYARDHFLKPGGRMFPQVGRVHVALFSDEVLYTEIAAKGSFWLQQNYYGVNITHLYAPSVDGYFSQVVVDAIDPSVLVSGCATKVFDFGSVKEEELHDISIPLRLHAEQQCNVHGVACWFDVLFDGSTTQRWLSTAPGLPTTHWFQLRCVLKQPLAVMAGTYVTGQLRLIAHERQSYDISLDLSAPPLQPGFPPQQASGKLDLKEPFYRQLTSWYPQNAGQQQQDGYAQPLQHYPGHLEEAYPLQQSQHYAHQEAAYGLHLAGGSFPQATHSQAGRPSQHSPRQAGLRQPPTRGILHNEGPGWQAPYGNQYL